MKKIILSALLAATTSTSFALSLPVLPNGTADLSKLGIDPNALLAQIPADVKARAAKIDFSKIDVNALKAKLPADIKAKVANFNPKSVDLAALRAKLKK